MTIRAGVARRASLVVYLVAVVTCASSLAIVGWTRTWTLVRLPTRTPPFADLRTVQAGIVSAAKGLDPQRKNPGDPWGRKMNYPSVWLTIGRLCSLDQERWFLIFCGLSCLAFVGACAALQFRFPSWSLLAGCLSSATLLAIERGNNDMHELLLVVAFVLLGRWTGLVPYTAAVALKVYPALIAYVAVVRRDLRRALALAVAMALALAMLWTQLRAIGAGNTAAGPFAYGAAGLYDLLGALCRGTAIGQRAAAGAIGGVALIALVTLIWRLARRRFIVERSLEGDLFLAGASIYVGTYVLARNWDYRMIFLLLCFPFLARQRWVGRVLRGLILFAMNGVWLDRLWHGFALARPFVELAMFVVLAALLLAPLLAGWGGRTGAAPERDASLTG
jgi:hypothetical protein